MPPTLKRGSSAWLRYTAWLVAALVLLLLSIDASNRLIQQTQSATLYCFYRNLWMTVSPLPDRPIDLGSLYDGQLWVASQKGVERFDGTRWVQCPEALKTARPAALAASAAGVWVLDLYGNLSHFDGSSWTVESLEKKLPGVTWGPRNSGHAAMEAASDGSLWILWDGLWHQTPTGWTEIRPQGEEVIGAKLVGQSGGDIWLARDDQVEAITPSGTVEARFRNDVLGMSGLNISKVISDRGSLWMATPAGFAVYDGASWRNLGAPPHSGGVLDAAPAFDGGLFVITSQPPVGVSARLTLALPVILVCAAALTLLAYAFFSILRLRRQRRGQAALPRMASPGYDPRNGIAASRTMEALRNADYRGAMRGLRLLSFGIPSRTMLLLESVVLSLGGLPEESEQSARRALARTTGDWSRFALDRLGSALTDLGRYDEARECLEEAIRLDDSFGLACADLAEVLLIEGRDAEYALELAERAAAAKPAPAAYRVGRQPDAEALALRAWALAAVGRRLDAEIAVQRALDASDQQYRPVVAGIYCKLGSALEVLRDHNAAMSHFRNAAMLDPHGKYGNFARVQLAQRSAWGVSA